MPFIRLKLSLLHLLPAVFAPHIWPFLSFLLSYSLFYEQKLSVSNNNPCYFSIGCFQLNQSPWLTTFHPANMWGILSSMWINLYATEFAIGSVINIHQLLMKLVHNNAHWNYLLLPFNNLCVREISCRLHNSMKMLPIYYNKGATSWTVMSSNSPLKLLSWKVMKASWVRKIGSWNNKKSLHKTTTIRLDYVCLNVKLLSPRIFMFAVSFMF